MENALMIPVQDVERMAVAIAKSQLFGMKTTDQVMALMLVAQAEGRHPATVAMEYDIIQGRPALRSQAALIRFQNCGGKIEWLERTNEKVSARFSHPQGGTIIVTWDMERAHQMGYDGKDNWRKQPMIMLQWRVVAEGVRACYPACLSGQYLDTEVRDFDQKETRPIQNAEWTSAGPDKKPVAEMTIDETAVAPEHKEAQEKPAPTQSAQPTGNPPPNGPGLSDNGKIKPGQKTALTAILKHNPAKAAALSAHLLELYNTDKIDDLTSVQAGMTLVWAQQK